MPIATIDRLRWQRIVEVRRDGDVWIDVLDCGHDLEHQGPWEGQLSEAFTLGRICDECPRQRRLPKVGGDQPAALRKGGSSYQAATNPEPASLRREPPLKAVKSIEGTQARLTCGHAVRALGAIHGQGIRCPQCSKPSARAWRSTRRVRKPVLLPGRPEDA